MEQAQITLQIILVLIGLYLAFIKSYFNEKGKNLATKEDVEEITELVETVKNQIHFTTQSKLSLRIEERNALVNCYEKYNLWLNSILDTYFGGITEESQSKLKEIEIKLSDAKFEFTIAEGRKNIFVNNKEIDILLSKLNIETLKFQHLIEEKIGELELLFFEIKKMRQNTPIEQQNVEYQKLLNKKKESMNLFREEKLNKYKEIAPLDKELQILVFNHLQELLEDE